MEGAGSRTTQRRVGTIEGLGWTFACAVGTMRAILDERRRHPGVSGSVSGIFLTVVLAQFKGTWCSISRMCICAVGPRLVRGNLTYATEPTSGMMLGEFGRLQPPNSAN